MANDIIITPVSASIQFSGSANASIKLTVDASGSLSITGNSGSLFSITDNLSGSLMSVNTIAGLPILEVFSDNRVNIGKYAAEAIKIQSGGSDVALGSGSVMFVTSSGRVGIGTTVPNTLLNVGSGTPSTAANGIQFGSDTSANLYRISTGVIKTDGGLTVGGTTNCNAIVGTTGTFSGQVSGSLFVEKYTAFTPTTVGWYRVFTSNVSVNGGGLRIYSSYNNKSDALELVWNSNGWGQTGQISIVKGGLYVGYIVSQVRVTGNSGDSSGYLDIYVSDVTSAGPISLYAYGPDCPAFTASIVVGAVTGSGTTKTLSVARGIGTTDQFYSSVTTGTAPLVVSSSTMVNNLNVQYLNGQLGSYYQDASNLNAGTISSARLSNVTASSLTIANSYRVANLTASNISASGTSSFGNVGIGTAIPLGKLHVYGLLRVGGAVGDQTGIIALGNDTNATASYGDNGMFRGGIGTLGSANYTNISSWQGIVFNVQNAEFGSQATRMIIDVNGNVGIGTTSPVTKLQVAGTSGTAIISVNNTSLNRSSSFGIDNTGAYLQNSTNGDYFDFRNATGTANIRVTHNTNTYLNTTYTSVGSLVSSGSKLSVFGNLSIGSTYGSTAAPTNGAIFEGNVGIGTTNPVNKLEVVGNISCSAITASNFFGTSSWSSNSLTASSLVATNSYTITNLTASNITASATSSFGRIGIGTSTIQNALTIGVVDATSSCLLIQSNTYNDLPSGVQITTQLGFLNGSSGNLHFARWIGGATTTDHATVGQVNNGTTYDLQFSAGRNTTGSINYFTASAVRMTIKSDSGNVGIGTTSPNTLLNVGSGTPSTAANGIQFGSDTSANLYRISTGVIKTDGGLTVTGTTNCAAISVNGSVNVYGASSGYIISRRDTSAAAWQWYSQTGELRLYDQINALDRLIVTTAGLFTFTSAISCSAITGSHFGTSSFAISASYAPGGSGLTGGTTNYIPLWTGATTQGISVISQSGTIIGLSGSLNVLQNVTASLFNGLNFIGGINTISSSTTTTVDLRYAVTQMQLSQSITTFAHSNATSGSATWMLATVGAGTAVTITWPTSYKWPGGVAPSLTTTSAKRDVYQFMSYDGSSTGSGYVFATVVAQNM